MSIDLIEIRWEQILILLHVIQASSSKNIDTIQRWYGLKSTDFYGTINFLRDINLLKLVDGEVKLLSEFKIISTDQGLKNLVVTTLINCNSDLNKYFGDFLIYFEENQGIYSLSQTLKDRLTNSGPRNFFISLGLLQFDSITNRYIASSEMSTIIQGAHRPLSYRSFKTRIKQEEILGYNAEILILRAEKEKLHRHPDLQKKIVHMSQVDVTAGYDIRSFSEQNGSFIKKYIEVKAVSKNDFRFFWSRNEINKSKIFGDLYYLYLIPISDRGEFETDNLKEIMNPYERVFKDNDSWINTVELTSFYLSK